MIEISVGNHKVGKDTFIFNICSATDCPSRPLGLCQIPDKCYAMKAERMYKQSLPYRRRQEKYWDEHNAEQIADDIKILLDRRRKVEIKYMRFGECGDFRNQVDIYKFYRIAELIPKLRFYAFTARKDLNFDGAPENCTVIGSGFMLHNSFTVIPKEEKGIYEYECPGSCITCSLCKEPQGLDIKVAVH